MLVVAGYLPPIPKNNKAPEQEAAKKTNVLSVSSLFYDVYSFLVETTYLKIYVYQMRQPLQVEVNIVESVGKLQPPN